MNYDAVIFDLFGTLVDNIGDDGLGAGILILGKNGASSAPGFTQRSRPPPRRRLDLSILSRLQNLSGLAGLSGDLD